MNPLQRDSDSTHSGSCEHEFFARPISLDPARGDLGLPRVSVDLAGDLFYSGFSFFPFWLPSRALPFYCFSSISTSIFGSHLLGG